MTTEVICAYLEHVDTLRWPERINAVEDLCRTRIWADIAFNGVFRQWLDANAASISAYYHVGRNR